MQPSASSSTSSSFSVPSSPHHNQGSVSRRMSWNRMKDDAGSSHPGTGKDRDQLTKDPPPRIDVPPPLGWYAYSQDDNDNDNDDSYNHPRTAPRPPFTSHNTRNRTDSQSSLDSPTISYPAGHFDDVRLTADAERVDAQSRYGHHLLRPGEDNPSPLKRGGEALMSAGKKLRRVSVRVVNFSGVGGMPMEDQEEARKTGDDFLDLGPGEPVVAEGGRSEPTDKTSVGPLRGRTLGFLRPDNPLRLAMYNFLIYQWTEPCILLLIVINAIVLTIQAARGLFVTDPFPHGGLRTREDIVLFGLFVIFTLETLARITVSGFILDPDVPISNLFFNPFHEHPFSFERWGKRLGGALSLNPTTNQIHTKKGDIHDAPTQPEFAGAKLRKAPPKSLMMQPRPLFTGNEASESSMPPAVPVMTHERQSSLQMPKYLPFEVAFQIQRSLARRGVPYLRHSWSRVDLIAILSFWISFGLSIGGLERTSGQHIGLFRALSVLRIARLLAVTKGTTTILRSLKTARPLLANVAMFVIFAMILFSIIGIQSFKGSFLRQCVVSLDDGGTTTYGQFCGGFIDPISLSPSSFLQLDGRVSLSLPRGFICPLGQTCQEQAQNPQSGLQSYDNVFAALLQVIVVSSVNTWAPVMYASIDAEFFVSCVFYLLGVVVMNFWLINLFVAVITTTFSGIREKTKRSAFGANTEGVSFDLADEGSRSKSRSGNLLKIWYNKARYVWIVLIVLSVGLQATKTPKRSSGYLQSLNDFELIATFLFDLEILWRFLAYLPNWRLFWQSRSNIFDLFLAVMCSVIQLPPVHSAKIFPWLTFFQLVRFYRVITVFPRMKPLLSAVFGNLSGLMNMIVFLLLTIYLSALVAVQMIRGDLTSDLNMNFGQIFNAFLAMYQVFSSENWTTVLYNVGVDEVPLRQAIITTVFIAGWFLFANFIILQMFVAVLHENIEIADANMTQKIPANRNSVQPIAKRSRFNWLKKYNLLSRIEIPAGLPQVLPPSNLKVERTESERSEYNFWSSDSKFSRQRRQASFSTSYSFGTKTSRTMHSTISLLNKFYAGDDVPDEIPLQQLRGEMEPGDKARDLDKVYRELEILSSVRRVKSKHHDAKQARLADQKRKEDYLARHPSYDTSLFIFRQGNPVRTACQLIVRPPGGERLFGTSHSFLAYAVFQTVLLVVVVAGVLIAAVASPLYRHNYFVANPGVRFAWFDVAESAFALTLVAEFFIKVSADGFVWTPNAFMRDVWNAIDFFIMLGLIVNVTTTFLVVGGLDRLTRSLTALRALRLITLIDNNRHTFQELIFAGAARIFDAVLLAMLYLIPYAVWGLNIFSGLMFVCNDPNSADKLGCQNEHVQNPVNNTELGFFAPRVWDNPHTSTYWSFDDFPSSLLILFEIVSLEGWIDVLASAVGITGKDQQPSTNATQANAIFFLFFNLLGAVVILTVFVSIIIGNFSKRTGTAFLSPSQRDWINLRKLLIRQRPSKRPRYRPQSQIRGWCYDRAVSKHGWWAQMMTCLFVLHIIVLMTQTFSVAAKDDQLRDDFFLLVTCVYAVDILVRLSGLGFPSFLANGWNIFDVLVVTGGFATTIPIRLGSTGFVVEQLQKLFLVLIAFKLVQRSNRMNHLFKTSRSSIPDILNLLGLWFILFLFFGILCLEVFGLTRWESAETHEQNFSSLGRALLMLAFMSTGEGWNQYMHDFALTYPRCTDSSSSNNISDCGSSGWAYVLFIAWNVLSMYIFVNMFTGVVVESFSYVTQLSGNRSIGREEMRAFKKLWGEHCSSSTSRLESNKFAEFFGRLTGKFEVRIYPKEFSVPNLKTAAAIGDALITPRSRSFVVDGINIRKLELELSKIDIATTRKRRAIYNRLMQEALYTSTLDAIPGVNFTATLLMIAHNKLVVGEDALSHKEQAGRQDMDRIVRDLLELELVRNLFRMAYDRRRFLESTTAHRRITFKDIPNIVVEDLPSAPSIPSAGWMRTPGASPAASPYKYPSEEPPSPSPIPRSISQRSLGLTTDDLVWRDRAQMNDGSLTPRAISLDDDRQLSPTDNSKWGEIMRRVSVRVSRPSPSSPGGRPSSSDSQDRQGTL